ncbi:MAG: DUF2384 domain-containing protein [Salinisphaera sp.]|jgi:hypothetical protein|nr:DUF2384 domain-containing protein [Salinisphaera sp.]
MTSSAVETQFSPANDSEIDAASMSAPALKAVFRIGELWHLSEDELATLLGGVPLSSLRRWKRQWRHDENPRATLSHDQLERVSYLLGIYKALHILLPSTELADSWIRRANTAPGFDGQPAIAIMCQGSMSDLQGVRRYLDAQRGW